MNLIEDADVLVIGYNRPELIQKRLIELKNSRVNRLHVSIDGSTPRNNREHYKILEEFTRTVPSKTNFSYLIHQTNLGLTSHVTSAISDFLKSSENAIIIEDDISINEATLQSLVLGLRELKTQNKKGTVGSYSPIHLPRVFEARNCFVESKYFLCWGWAVSKDTWVEYDSNLDFNDIHSALIKSKTWIRLNKKQRDVWARRFERVSQNPQFTWDFQMQFASFRSDMIHLLPLGSLVVNEGYSDQRATHTFNSKPKWMANGKLSKYPITFLAKSRFMTIGLDLILGLTVVGDQSAWVKRLSKTLGYLTEFKNSKI